MPNFKIIQDMPDQARIKIYGSQDLALNTDTSGNLAITTLGNALAITTAAGSPLAITTSGNSLSITTAAGSPLAITTSGNALSITTAAGSPLAITTSGNALSITTAAGSPLEITPSGSALSITTAAGSPLAITTSGNALSITTAAGSPLAITTSTAIPVIGALVTSDVTYQTGSFSNVDLALTTPNQNVLGINKWSWIAYNTSAADASAVVKMEGSPDGVRWIDNSSVVTLAQYGITCMVPSYFLKYSRVYYSAAGSTSTSLNVYFQGQS